LTVIPDAPRVAEQGFPPHFTWDILPAKFYDAPIRASHSEYNLSSNPSDSKVLKPSASAFDIIGSNGNDILNGGDEEDVQKVENERPMT
jgi:hypothetical protein